MFTERSVLADIQGDVQRKEATTDGVMTETRHLPQPQLAAHTHQRGCCGFILEGEYLKAFPPHKFVCKPRSVVFRSPLLEHENFIGGQGARSLFVEVSNRWLDHVREFSPILAQSAVLLPHVAHEVGLHLVYVSRVFRQHYGVAIGDFVLQLRIDFARDRLQRSVMQLAVICLSTGFSSPACFSTMFRRETGFTPAAHHRGHPKFL